MLDGFGLAPVCLQIDLDSYEGPWTHVHRFRGRSGWLVVAGATVFANHQSWDTTIVVACDEWGEAVPSFMAPNLLACACSRPQPTHDHPPEELDDLLEQEKTNLLAHWLRDTNRGLAELLEASEQRIAALEARTRAFVDAGERQITELRRRRRITALNDCARGTIDSIILEIEADCDAELEQMTTQRALLRGEVASREEALIARNDTTVEVEILYQVQWHAPVERNEAQLVADALYRQSPSVPDRIPYPLDRSSWPSDAAGPCQVVRRLMAEISRLELHSLELDVALARRWDLSRYTITTLRREAKTVKANLKAARDKRTQLMRASKAKR